MSTFPLLYRNGTCKAGAAVVRAPASHQCAPGSNPGVDATMWVEFVVGSLLYSERFFSGLLQFCPLFKNQHFKVSIRRVIRLIKNHLVDVLALNRYSSNLLEFQTMYCCTCTLCPNHSLGLPSSSGIFSASTEKSVRMSCNMNSFNKNELHRI